MTPIAAVDGDGQRCVIVAFVPLPSKTVTYGGPQEPDVLAVVTYGGNGRLFTVPINELEIAPNETFPMFWLEWPELIALTLRSAK